MNPEVTSPSRPLRTPADTTSTHNTDIASTCTCQLPLTTAVIGRRHPSSDRPMTSGTPPAPLTGGVSARSVAGAAVMSDTDRDEARRGGKLNQSSAVNVLMLPELGTREGQWFPDAANYNSSIEHTYRHPKTKTSRHPRPCVPVSSKRVAGQLVCFGDNNSEYRRHRCLQI